MESAIILNPSDLRSLIAETVNSCLADWSDRPINDTPHQKAGYLTRREVCNMLHVTLATLHAWTKEGKLRPYRIGNRILYKEVEVVAAVKPVSYSVK